MWNNHLKVDSILYFITLCLIPNIRSFVSEFLSTVGMIFKSRMIFSDVSIPQEVFRGLPNGTQALWIWTNRINGLLLLIQEEPWDARSSLIVILVKPFRFGDLLWICCVEYFLSSFPQAQRWKAFSFYRPCTAHALASGLTVSIAFVFRI